MRRIFVLAMALLAATAAFGQQIKVDREGILKKIEKSDQDIANDKKNTKAAAWLERGKVFVEAATAPTNGLYVNLDKATAGLMFGQPQATETRKVGNNEFEVLVYPAFDAYTFEGRILFWDRKTVVVENALAQGYNAYGKAYELDPKSAPRVKEGVVSVANAYKEDADNVYSLGEYVEAGDAFRNAYDVQLHPAVGVIDSTSIFNAGLAYTIGQSFEKGLECLTIARDLGFDKEGSVYYYMFHCYFGLERNDEAREILFAGLSKYPGNNDIVEGLMGIYSVAGGDPNDIIPYVEKAIASDPENPELWGGMGRIYDKLGDTAKAIEAFTRAVSLAPGDFGANFNIGLLYIKNGDVMNQKLNATEFTSNSAYTEALDNVNGEYAKAIAPLEKANALNPSDAAAVELLKNVCFRLRDNDGMMDKYNKYNEMFKKMTE